MPFGKSKAPMIDPDEWYGKSLERLSATATSSCSSSR